MEEIKTKTFLGYRDEQINDENSFGMNFTTNKIGGVPNWVDPKMKVLTCMCKHSRQLILQLYSPLENQSTYHRTLYIFSCVNPNCTVKSKSWICLRIQTLVKDNFIDCGLKKKGGKNVTSKLKWCNEVDNWDKNFKFYENQSSTKFKMAKKVCKNDKTLKTLDLNLANQNNDCLNFEAVLQGKIGNIFTKESTHADQGNKSTLAVMKNSIRRQKTLMPTKFENQSLRSFYIYVEEEKFSSLNTNKNINNHVFELFEEYQLNEKESLKAKESTTFDLKGCNMAINKSYLQNFENESYEKSIPAHGDLMFYNFISIIQENPGQIIRYCRNSSPVLISPLSKNNSKCRYCKGETLCEIQILPSLIPFLQLENNAQAPIEFGNVLVYTCLQSCWKLRDKVRIENIVVQEET